MTCIYGCKSDGRPCPRPYTCHTLGPKLASERAADEQAKTDRQQSADQCCTGDCRQGRDCAESSPVGQLATGIAIVMVVLLTAFVLSPALAGYLKHMG